MTLPIFILSLIVAVLGTMILTAIAVTLILSKKYETFTKNQIASSSEIARQQGCEIGSKAAFDSFSFEITKYIEVKESYFRKTATYGYQTTIKLKGFQIFEPIRNEIGSIEKFKDQHVDGIIEKIDKQIDLLIGKIPEVPVKKIEDYVLKKKKH
jgi:hypothetical protein